MEEFEELASEQWPSFFEAFSRTHRGWLVRMWVIDTVSLESGMLDNSTMVIRDLALWDIATETRGDTTDLIIMTRDSRGDTHSDHPVRDIRSLTIERDQDGEDTGLLIETADMQTTVLRLRVATAAEAVDGLSPQERP